jgi:hypothetical protein
MVRVNLLRTLPPQTEEFDEEEDEPAMEGREECYFLLLFYALGFGGIYFLPVFIISSLDLLLHSSSRDSPLTLPRLSPQPLAAVMWPHLQVVYEFFLRFIVSTEVNGKIAKR